MLKKEAALLEGAERSQITGSKRKEVTARDEERQQPSKKTREKQLGKYCRGAAVKMEGSNLCKRCVCAKQDCLVYLSRWVIFYYTYYYYFFIIFFFIADPSYVPDILLSSSSVYPTPIPTLWPWSLLIAESWVLLKRYSGSLWRSTEKLGRFSGTWWRAKRGIWHNWRGLGPQWSRDKDWKGRAGRRRTEMKRKGPRKAPEKVRRRELRCPPSIRLVVSCLFLNRIFIFCELNVWVRKVIIKMKRSLKFWKKP